MSFLSKVRNFLSDACLSEKAELEAQIQSIDKQHEASVDYSPPPKKSCLVLWSGGLDSTFLIEKRLQEGWIVEAAYVEIENNAEKVERELDAVDRLLKHFESNERFNYLGQVYSCNVLMEADHLKLRQLPVWMSALAYASSRPVEEVCLGYVENRECIQELQTLWEAWIPFFFKRPPRLAFPLIEDKVTKHSMLMMSPSWLVENTTYCESEEGGCGKCKPCLTRKLVELEISK